ncbi:DUF2271 domain-containing protein [Comamonadaceae bacterium OH2545_COT-014]|nr:DUF2271 domain-containing protein [Comamonadaceae bacterium OH2545_COT-014]
MKKVLSVFALTSALGAPALAAGLDVQVEIPRLNVAEYHRPYVAVWIESADPAAVPPATLAVWYEVKTRNGEGTGTKWLKDMRQWWRRTGRDLTMPIDGVSGATRPAGVHALSFTEGSGPMPKLPAGSYKLMVEAAREVGGRELLTVPFTWPPAAGATQAQAQGSHELGAVRLTLKP